MTDPVSHVEVRSGAYHDSVTLMQVSQAIQARPGVGAALVAMATPLNLQMLQEMGLRAPSDPSPNQLVVAIRAKDRTVLDAAVSSLDSALAERTKPSPSGFGAAAAPRTIGAASRRVAATLALVSTPGRVAAVDAADALDAGLDVMLFSDNVSLENEVALKVTAQERGLLLMGPDCGTAVVCGVGLGFANVVRPGPVGIVAASGTGAQHVMTLLDAADVGVRHCLGVGGRDLSAEVAGRSTLRALDLLAADPAVEVVAVVSKPPAAETAGLVRAHAEGLGKPVVFALLGPGQPDITAAARSVAEAAGGRWCEPADHPPQVPAKGRGRYLRGLFAGGTLCDEAMLIASARLGDIASNIPLSGSGALDPTRSSRGHTMIDFGDDALTVGRPHPMIDGSLRVERLDREARDPEVGALLLDVVLGHGAHPDPASQLGPAVSAARSVRDVPVLVSLIGTRDDPQGLTRQAEGLREAGAHVFLSNAAATRTAVSLLGGANR